MINRTFGQGAGQLVPRVLVLAGIGWLGMALPALPEAPAASPVVADTLRLLEEGVPETVIVRWLSEQPRPERTPSASELIALQRAGASERVLEALMGAGESAAEAGADPELAALAEEGGVVVDLRASYRPDFDEEEIPRDLHLYLDGRPVATLPARWSRSGETVRRLLTLEPGNHRLRVAAERPVGAERKTWFAPERLDFELAEHASWRLEVRFEEARFPAGPGAGPLAVQLYRDGEPVRRIEPVTTGLWQWPPLCDQADAGARGCVTWSELWPEWVETPPTGSG